MKWSMLVLSAWLLTPLKGGPSLLDNDFINDSTFFPVTLLYVSSLMFASCPVVAFRTALTEWQVICLGR